MKKVLSILIPILICFLVGITASYFQADAIKTWYPLLNKPYLTPPNIVFPVVWSILYVCMGVSIGLIINSDKAERSFLVKLFSIQLFFNFLWSINFFYLQNPLLGLLNIILLDIFVFNYIVKSYPVNRVSSILFVPYMCWILFATYLNGYILWNNSYVFP